MDSKIDIRQFSLKELTEEFISFDEKSFRAKQVYSWLWKKGISDFNAMTNLSKDLREILISKYDCLIIKHTFESKNLATFVSPKTFNLATRTNEYYFYYK